MVSRCHFLGLHLVKLHSHAPLGQLPGRFTAGQTGSHYFYLCHCAFSLVLVVFFVFVVLVVLAVLVDLAGFSAFSSWGAAPS